MIEAKPAEPLPAGADCQPPVDPRTKVPPVAAPSRLGYFLILPEGPAYYSLHDKLRGELREKPPRFPYGSPVSLSRTPAFDWDFRYLDDPKNMQFDWADDLKRIRCGDHFLFSTGGELRYRYANEIDSRLLDSNNTYDLTRVRVYGDAWYKDEYRVFVEFIDARSYGQDLVPMAIDDTNSDLLNAFVELKAFEANGSPVYIRAGRQELLYGSERLISTLDWANTRRTFQGIKGYWQSAKWDVDLFWVQPVVANGNRFDSVDDNRNFLGAWGTYKIRPGNLLDIYALNLSRSRPIDRGNVTTLGSRYIGDKEGRLLYEFEGMYQVGDRGGKSVSAHSYSAGIGYRCKEACFNPQIWVYYDLASGNPDPDAPVDRRFDQLFPFGHYYLGYLDLIGRQNIRDLNVQVSFYPAAWIVGIIQVHNFRLDTPRDALYGANGLPLRRDPTGLAGSSVGNEVDFFMNFHISGHQDVMFGYSRLYAGPFLQRTGLADAPELFYAQYSFRW